MTEYHKIKTVWLRDPETKHRTLLEGQWATPEFEYLADMLWLWSEKIDGTNIRVRYTSDGRLHGVSFGGRTDNAQIPATLVQKLTELFPASKMTAAFPDTEAVTLYGEGYGAKIQKGGGNYIPDGQSFILFDVRVGKWWLKRDDVHDIASKLGVLFVPPAGSGTLSAAVELVRGGYPSTLADGRCPAEGLVMRPATELYGRDGQRVIAKIKRKDFPAN